VSSRSPMPTADLKTRPLGADDLAAVVAIDAAEGAQPRRRYLERRLAQALRFPELHAQFAVEANGKLSGFVLGRLLEGEFGQTEPGLRLEEIGVRTEARGRGTGRTLIAALEDWGRQRGALEMRTTALWTQHAMLRFLEADGWRLGRNQVLDCVIGEEELGSARERPLASPDEERPGDANDYSARGANDFEALARDLTEVRALNAADLDGVARIDRRLTGGDRSRYLRHAIDEALAESGIRVSLAAIVDGSLAGYVMARVDLGDFGRTAPVAILDTLGVDPLRQGHGIGRALLSQLLVNLAALRVERVETVVALRNVALLAFFVRAGFAPAERLAFVKPLA